jgi:hypothetical protein
LVVALGPDLTPFMRGIILVSEASLGTGFNLDGIGLRAEAATIT